MLCCPMSSSFTVLVSSLLAALACNHNQVFVVEFRGAPGRALVRARGELQEGPVEHRNPLWFVGEACVNRDHGSEGRLDEVAIGPWAVGPLRVPLANHLQRLDPVTE